VKLDISGVPLVIFNEGIQETFLAEWKKIVGTEFTFVKMLITKNIVRALPAMVLQIRAHDGVDKPNLFDALLAQPATHYMEYNLSTGTYQAKINLFSKLGPFLGINAMKDTRSSTTWRKSNGRSLMSCTTS